MHLRILLPFILTLLTGCQTSNLDSAIDTGHVADTEVNPDTGPQPFDNCTELQWRTKAELLLTNQPEVDDFCYNWNAIEGNLTIDLDGDEDAPIWELDGLSCLCEVTGDVEIYFIPGYSPDSGAPPPPHSSTDLELPLLERVGGNLWVRDIWGLAQMSFMSALTSVGGDLTLQALDNLAGVSLAGLETIGGTLHVEKTHHLQSIEMPALSALGGLSIEAQSAMDLESLRKISFPQISAIQGEVSLVGLQGLYQFEAPLLEEITGDLTVSGSCTYTPDLPNLASVGSLTLQGNCGFTSLSALPLTTINGKNEDGVSVWIEGNDGLTQNAIDDFMSNLSLLGTGTVYTVEAEDGACAEWQQANWKIDEAWCDD